MAIDTPKKAYTDAMATLAIMDAVTAGEKAVKALGERTLVKPNTGNDHEDYYEAYKKRAVFYPATAWTANGLIGAAFKRDPVLQAEGIEFVETDINHGESIYQQSQECLRNVLKHGYAGLFVDYPVTEEISLAEKREGNIHAVCMLKDRASIINWHYDNNKLVLVVLHENIVEMVDYKEEVSGQITELYIENGIYKVRVYSNKDGGTWTIKSENAPLMNNRPQKEIPFYWVGAQTNTPSNTIPLEALASINLHHYRNSADYEDSVYICSQAQPVAINRLLTPSDVKGAGASVFRLGSRRLLDISLGGDFKFVQASPNSMAFEAMTHKEAQMLALGARLIQQTSEVKTATQVDAETDVNHSVLSLAVSNINEAYTKALITIAGFEGVEAKELSYKITQDFSTTAVDMQEALQVMQLWQGRAIPTTDKNDYLRKVGLIAQEKTDDEVEAELDATAID